jgi:hypothetical protein
MSQEKMICPTCEKEGNKSLVFFYYNLNLWPFNTLGGYFDYDGNWVKPRMDFAPWFQCSRGHIWQKLK